MGAELARFRVLLFVFQTFNGAEGIKDAIRFENFQSIQYNCGHEPADAYQGDVCLQIRA